MKLGLILSQTARETTFNALRLTNYSLKQGDCVKSRSSETVWNSIKISNPKFKAQEEVRTLLDAGGHFLACGRCLKLRHSAVPEVRRLSTVKDLYEVIRDSDRVLAF